MIGSGCISIIKNDKNLFKPLSKPLNKHAGFVQNSQQSHQAVTVDTVTMELCNTVTMETVTMWPYNTVWIQ